MKTVIAVLMFSACLVGAEDPPQKPKAEASFDIRDIVKAAYACGLIDGAIKATSGSNISKDLQALRDDAKESCGAVQALINSK